MRKENRNYVLMLASLVARNAKGAMVDPVVGSGTVWRQASGLSRREDVLTVNAQSSQRTFYKCCDFYAICKANAAISRISFQRKERYIPVKFDGQYYASLRHSKC
jgi:hypothetical protein